MGQRIFPRLYANLLNRLQDGAKIFFVDGDLVGEATECDAGIFLDYEGEEDPADSFLVPAEFVLVLEGVGDGFFRIRPCGSQ